jgi:uncharacterized Zn finger protein
VPTRARRESKDVKEVVCDLSAEELREIVRSAVDRHPDVERHVLLAAARSEGDLGELRREIDRGLRTRRFLDYHESSAWARAAQPVLEELRLAAEKSPSAELLALIERAVGHVVKVIMHADDSNGTIGDLARELLDLHAQLCDAGVADAVKVAEWMVRLSCDDQDFFEIDPVRYRAALGENGLAAYRQAIEQRHADGSELFAVRWARERLAVLDGDTEAVVALLGGDLSAPHQFIAVCEAMAELGREDDVLSFALRGIAETSGWQVDKLYDLACDVHERAGAPVEALALRRQQHERTPSASTYSTLRRAAEALGAWGLERDAARRVLRERDRGSYVDALLQEGDVETAWAIATEDPTWDPGGDRRARLAHAREPTHPDEALSLYMLVAGEELLQTGRRAYARAIAMLKRARRAASASEQDHWFSDQLLDLREQHRRRPALIEMLDKAKLP